MSPLQTPLSDPNLQPQIRQTKLASLPPLQSLTGGMQSLSHQLSQAGSCRQSHYTDLHPSRHSKAKPNHQALMGPPVLPLPLPQSLLGVSPPMLREGLNPPPSQAHYLLSHLPGARGQVKLQPLTLHRMAVMQPPTPECRRPAHKNSSSSQQNRNSLLLSLQDKLGPQVNSDLYRLRQQSLAMHGWLPGKATMPISPIMQPLERSLGLWMRQICSRLLLQDTRLPQTDLVLTAGGMCQQSGSSSSKVRFQRQVQQSGQSRRTQLLLQLLLKHKTLSKVGLMWPAHGVQLVRMELQTAARLVEAAEGGAEAGVAIAMQAQ